MKAAFLALAIVVCGWFPASAQTGHSWTAALLYSCPYADCTAAAGTISNPTMLATQAKSGQSYATATGLCTNINCHPPWLLIGVDVPNGALTATGLMHDPKTTYTNSCSYPTDGVNYCATGNSFNNGPRLLVQATNAPLTVSQFNLSTMGGHGCVQVQIKNTSAYPITLTDWFFENDATCSNTMTIGNTSLILLSTYPIAVDLTISHFTAIGHGNVDDCCSIPHTGTTNIPNANFALISFTASTANETVSYGNVSDWPGRIVSLGGLNNTTLKAQTVSLFANYFGAMNTRCPQGHGEYYSVAFAATFNENYDVYPLPTTVTCMSAPIFMSTSSSNIDTIDFGYNTMMANRIGGSTVDSESVTISDVTNGVITVSSGGSHLAPGAFTTNTGSTIAFATQLSPTTWQSDCGVNTATGDYLTICPCSTDGSHGCFINTNGNFHSPKTLTLGYYLGNALFTPAHVINQNMTIHNNYMAGTGAGGGGAIFAPGGTCANPTVFFGNVNMETGAAQDFWTGGPGATGC